MLLLKISQNALTTLLHSADDMAHLTCKCRWKDVLEYQRLYHRTESRTFLKQWLVFSREIRLQHTYCSDCRLRLENSNRQQTRRLWNQSTEKEKQAGWPRNYLHYDVALFSKEIEKAKKPLSRV